MKKTGFIAIVGRPNVGKSTLLNSILGEKVAIVSSKPQTTRNRILGIHTVGENQYVFLDTPGMHTPKNTLGEYMVNAANSSMQEADAVILVVDTGKEITAVDENVISYLKKSGIPSILALNKIDMYRREDIAASLAKYSEKHSFDAFVPISARSGKNVAELLSECDKFLSESEWFFPEDMVTDQPERQIVAEFIREKTLRLLNQEIPHGVAVEIERMKKRDNGTYEILAAIYCERQSHKAIIIGKKGEKLKEIGSRARQDIERFLDSKVYLELWVKVKEDWRNKEAFMNTIGFE